MKIILTIIPTNLVANLLLPSFCPFFQTKQESGLQQVGAVLTRNIFLFIANCALLQSHAKFNRLS